MDRLPMCRNCEQTFFHPVKKCNRCGYSFVTTETDKILINKKWNPDAKLLFESDQSLEKRSTAALGKGWGGIAVVPKGEGSKAAGSSPAEVRRKRSRSAGSEDNCKKPEFLENKDRKSKEEQESEEFPGSEEEQKTEEFPGSEEEQKTEEFPGSKEEQKNEEFPGREEEQKTEEFPESEEEPKQAESSEVEEFRKTEKFSGSKGNYNIPGCSKTMDWNVIAGLSKPAIDVNFINPQKNVKFDFSAIQVPIREAKKLTDKSNLNRIANSIIGNLNRAKPEHTSRGSQRGKLQKWDISDYADATIEAVMKQSKYSLSETDAEKERSQILSQDKDKENPIKHGKQPQKFFLLDDRTEKVRQSLIKDTKRQPEPVDIQRVLPVDCVEIATETLESGNEIGSASAPSPVDGAESRAAAKAKFLIEEIFGPNIDYNNADEETKALIKDIEMMAYTFDSKADGVVSPPYRRGVVPFQEAKARTPEEKLLALSTAKPEDETEVDKMAKLLIEDIKNQSKYGEAGDDESISIIKDIVKQTKLMNVNRDDGSENLEIDCEYWDKGCCKRVEPSNMKTHLEECEFRPVPCFLKGQNGCSGELVDVEDFYDHLNIVHEKTYWCNDDSKGRYFDRGHVQSLRKPKMDITIKRFEEYIFIQHDIVKDNKLYWWISIIGRKISANKFMASVYPLTEHFKSLENLERPFPWKVLVVPLHECEFEKVLRNEDTYACIPCHKVAIDFNPEDDLYYDFDDGIEIMRKEPF